MKVFVFVCLTDSCCWLLDTLNEVLRHIQPVYAGSTCLPTYLPRYMHACIHTYIHTLIHVYIHAYIHTYIQTYRHTDMQIHIHTHIHTHIHSQIRVHTYVDSCDDALAQLLPIETLVILRWFDRLFTWRLETHDFKTPPFCMYLCLFVLSGALLNRLIYQLLLMIPAVNILEGCQFEVWRNGLGINDAGYRWLHFGWCTWADRRMGVNPVAGTLTLATQKKSVQKLAQDWSCWIHL